MEKLVKGARDLAWNREGPAPDGQGVPRCSGGVQAKEAVVDIPDAMQKDGRRHQEGHIGVRFRETGLVHLQVHREVRYREGVVHACNAAKIEEEKGRGREMRREREESGLRMKATAIMSATYPVFATNISWGKIPLNVHELPDE
ncbi:MAG TPA: hypothetical protein VNI77_06040 [Nitrososphaera sp.]|nr:hypothetical protein [Nitrososphaera sp.]